MTSTTISPLEFDYIRDFVRRRAAIVLEDGKEYLALSRLAPVARANGLGSVSELVSALRTAPPGSPLHELVVDAMTTNETSFFRDVHPFDSLRTAVLPEVIERNKARRTLDIWCAAASSGQEPYSLAMLIREHFPLIAGWTVRILATDISPSMVAKAKTGRYGQLEVNRGLPAPLLIKYFHRAGANWELDDSVKRMVRFELHNLVGAWPPMPLMDIVMMRNVLIYFDVETRKSILDRVRRALRPDGYLLLGSAETTLNLDVEFERSPQGRTTWYRNTLAAIGIGNGLH
jgi:chemotaxis protein methyltransferase CheR